VTLSFSLAVLTYKTMLVQLATNHQSQILSNLLMHLIMLFHFALITNLKSFHSYNILFLSHKTPLCKLLANLFHPIVLQMILLLQMNSLPFISTPFFKIHLLKCLSKCQIDTVSTLNYNFNV